MSHRHSENDLVPAALTRCSSFLRRTGGCSCNTESASTLSVDWTTSSTPCMALRSLPPAFSTAVSATSMDSDHAICAASTTSWAYTQTGTQIQKHGTKLGMVSIYGSGHGIVAVLLPGFAIIAKPGNKTAAVSWPDPYTPFFRYRNSHYKRKING